MRVKDTERESGKYRKKYKERGYSIENKDEENEFNT